MPGQSAASTAKRRDAKWYRDQILKLQNQLPALNEKIAQLQAGIDGKATGDGKHSTRPLHAGAGDWRVELAQLQKQRDDIEARINTLQVQARRAGIPANALP
jgi:chaperonin cofactor prefoldin